MSLSPNEELELLQLLVIDTPRIDFQSWLRQVTPTWTWNWAYQEYIQTQLERVTSGELKKLILSVPPRHGKSEMTTVRYPIYRLENDPTLRVIVGAYNQTLANKFSRKARRIARERLSLSDERNAMEDWETTAGGGFRAVGVGGGVTGQGGDLIIVDDPVKNREEANSETYREKVWEWYTDDLYTRLEPGGAIIVIMTRWHEDDLAGRILASEDAPNWEVINLPAEAEDDDPLGREPGEPLCPARYDKEALADRKLVLGSFGYSALFQGRPVPASGSIIKREWFKYFTLPPIKFDKIIQSWDMAFKDADSSDYVVGTVWGKRGGYYFLLDLVRERMGLPETLRAVQAMSNKWPQALTKLVEDKANGTAVIQMLQSRISGLIPVEPMGSKEARISSVAPLFEAGNVWISDNAAYAQDYVKELCAFPTGAHDDQVDSTSQALIHFVGDLSQVEAGVHSLSDYARVNPNDVDEDPEWSDSGWDTL